MNIAIAINEKYIPYAYVMLTSLFENNQEDRVCVYILHSVISDGAFGVFDELAQKYTQTIKYLRVDQNVFGDSLPHNHEWTMEIYYRLALPELLPAIVDRVLYLDVDIIVMGSLRELYNIDFKGKTLAACKDMGTLYGSGSLSDKQAELFAPLMEDGTYHYFNSGVLLMNIAKMRREEQTTDFFVRTGEMIADKINGDQDILNFVYHHDVLYADEERYNIFARTIYNMGRGYDWVKEHGVIVHFTGRKPWQHEAVRYNTEKIFWKYAEMTPYYVKLLEQVVMGEVESGFMEQIIRKMENEKMQLNDTLQKCMDVLARYVNIEA